MRPMTVYVVTWEKYNLDNSSEWDIWGVYQFYKNAMLAQEDIRKRHPKWTVNIYTEVIDDEII